ncbi:L-fucose:H+ symporter permease [Campylobacter insulaenigrae]|uniref:L-fucose:H+ symporter permease n=1 Tax=Campylobacter insulaenigrae TaxID=260714 RepID=A0ABY3G6Y9_9BACT|nr:L-fucose:H+ symporter permease [Campylobacter insulaenigrae]MCR6570545.1 L-fucose:H+ symporter permease [Campylobacter insulaenigrae]MCR6572322.1 L-fucose:H+ symporter permease [Campylobacter insulaenigrae]MCR6573653.1 L-fucose:H+ symporter permease [Campylobacter insulaenigrae]MCR6575239.1 L-fucose:H+ symporter permease [Campylobacter insulaenigrae]MCR6576677.1 L-fucose:H+ symporter permease [Campylobacter insulaenigrae]
MNENSRNIKIAIILVTSLFFLWGVSYGLIDVMNKNFQNHLHITQHESGFLQLAYFGAYFIIALPAGYIANRFSYKMGIIFGLALYAIGCLLIIPATNIASFGLFLFAFFILACGIGSLETSANPYMVKLGDEKNASFRINAAQSFNGFGQFVGPIIGGALFLSITKQEEGASADQIEQALLANMSNVQLVYVGIAAIVLLILILFALNKIPEGAQVSSDYAKEDTSKAFGVFKHSHFNFGLIAQFLYVANQVAAGAFFINYATEHYEGLSDEKAAYYFSIALVAFMMGRILSTPLMKKIKGESILGIYSLINVLLCVGLYFSSGLFSVILLIALFFFMSISFPTIFAVSTKNLPFHQVKLAGSLLVMSIVGGAISPLIIGAINDHFGTSMGYLAMAPLFLYVAWYGFLGSKIRA